MQSCATGKKKKKHIQYVCEFVRRPDSFSRVKMNREIKRAPANKKEKNTLQNKISFKYYGSNAINAISNKVKCLNLNNKKKKIKYIT